MSLVVTKQCKGKLFYNDRYCSFVSNVVILFNRKENSLQFELCLKSYVMEIVISDKMMRHLNQDSTREVNDIQSKRHPNLPFFSFKMIMAATKSFAPENKLGQGGFGSVYKVNKNSSLTGCCVNILLSLYFSFNGTLENYLRKDEMGFKIYKYFRANYLMDKR